MPETNVHRGDEEIGGVQLHTYYHNVSAVAIFLSVSNSKDFANSWGRLNVEDTTLIVVCTVQGS